MSLTRSKRGLFAESILTAKGAKIAKGAKEKQDNSGPGPTCELLAPLAILATLAVKFVADRWSPFDELFLASCVSTGARPSTGPDQIRLTARPPELGPRVKR